MLPNATTRYVVALLLLAIAIVLQPAQVLAWPLRWYVVGAFIMPTASMSPTIVPRDRFLVHKLVTPKRWDIVAVRVGDPKSPTNVYCERLVGLPGETIEIVGGKVKINGTLVTPPPGPAPYNSTVSPRAGAPPIRRSDGVLGNGIQSHPITLGPDEYYFLGDNSPIAGDSRYWDWSVDGRQAGTLPRDHIIGVVTWTYWPPTRWRKLR
jgi:signal peptidase I